LHDTLGTFYKQQDEEEHWHINCSYEFIVCALRREYGLLELPRRKGEWTLSNFIDELQDFLIIEPDHERVLDAIELSFQVIDRETRNREYRFREDASELADKAIDELNYRFKEHGVGFQFINGQIVRIDSELIHEEIVKPALALLHSKEFSGAEEEFLKAHEHYRHGSNEEALNECLKAFESTMKVICDKRQWAYGPRATSKNLIHVCLEKELIPTFWLSHYTALRTLLESSVPTGRNNLSGHGQGSIPHNVPDYLVAYMLHMTASAIVFLVEAEQHLP
jgi:Domain of unknown function (DUF7014)/AbiJ N-terminal domain 4